MFKEEDNSNSTQHYGPDTKQPINDKPFKFGVSESVYNLHCLIGRILQVDITHYLTEPFRVVALIEAMSVYSSCENFI